MLRVLDGELDAGAVLHCARMVGVVGTRRGRGVSEERRERWNEKGGVAQEGGRSSHGQLWVSKEVVGKGTGGVMRVVENETPLSLDDRARRENVVSSQGKNHRHGKGHETELKHCRPGTRLGPK